MSLIAPFAGSSSIFHIMAATISESIRGKISIILKKEVPLTFLFKRIADNKPIANSNIKATKVKAKVFFNALKK